MYDQLMTTSPQRLMNRECRLVKKTYFTGRDRLDRPVEMNRLEFFDLQSGVMLIWNTSLRPLLKVGNRYRFSATPLEEVMDYTDGPQRRVTRGKVYDALAVS